MKLTIEHLAGYLPYGVEYYVHNHRCKLTDYEFQTNIVWGIINDAEETVTTVDDLDKIKPILRSFKQLKEKHVEEIAKVMFKYNSKPEYVLNHIKVEAFPVETDKDVTEYRCIISSCDKSVIANVSIECLSFHLEPRFQFNLLEYNQLPISLPVAAITQILYKHHYDIHGLIDQGLAVEMEE